MGRHALTANVRNGTDGFSSRALVTLVMHFKNLIICAIGTGDNVIYPMLTVEPSFDGKSAPQLVVNVFNQCASINVNSLQREDVKDLCFGADDTRRTGSNAQQMLSDQVDVLLRSKVIFTLSICFTVNGRVSDTHTDTVWKASAVLDSNGMALAVQQSSQLNPDDADDIRCD
ncbi:hypothetical protein ABVT39_004527 [Epinephelus coioides]